jgi:hypothetical protein
LVCDFRFRRFYRQHQTGNWRRLSRIRERAKRASGYNNWAFISSSDKEPIVPVCKIVEKLDDDRQAGHRQRAQSVR